MSDQDLIDRVAELWDRGGGDVTGFWMSVRRIAEAIDDLQDRMSDADIADATSTSEKRAELRGASQ